MLTREEIRETALANKNQKSLTWPQVGEAIKRSPVYAAMLVYGYGQATTEEASGLVKLLSLPEEATAVLMKAPTREPDQPWPPYLAFDVDDQLRAGRRGDVAAAAGG